jgi:hypothetical protein
MKQIVLSACAMLLFAVPSHAGNTRFDRSLTHLDPTTRLEQVCAVETMTRVGKDDNPYRPDRAVIYALSKPKLTGDTVTGNGGAFRSKGKWYQYSFTCKTTPDRMKVSTFTYKVGKPVPEEKWETYGLYR